MKLIELVEVFNNNDFEVYNNNNGEIEKIDINTYEDLDSLEVKECFIVNGDDIRVFVEKKGDETMTGIKVCCSECSKELNVEELDFFKDNNKCATKCDNKECSFYGEYAFKPICFECFEKIKEEASRKAKAIVNILFGKESE